MEHIERLFDEFLAEDVWELCVHLHIEKHLFLLECLREWLLNVVDWSSAHYILGREAPIEHLIQLHGALAVE